MVMDSSKYRYLPTEWKEAGIGGIPLLPPEEGVWPKYDDLYKAFHLCKPNATRVVWIGQDPYPAPGKADGLAFSCRFKPYPPSLKAILNELASNTGIVKTNGDLSGWAKQGVLLLNTALTVKSNRPGSHQKLWQEFTESVISVVNKHPRKVFVLLGAEAQKWEDHIDTSKHFVVRAGHPSPLNRKRDFKGCKLFTKINLFLSVTNSKPIDWGA